MSSFQSLKSSRDKRHAPLKAYTRDLTGSNLGAERKSSSEPTTKSASQSGSADASRTPTTDLSIDGTSRTYTPVSELDGVEVRRDAKRGRGLFASKSHSAGGVIYTTGPLQAVPSSSQISRVCSGCLLTPREIEIQTGKAPILSACPGCNVLRYCSPKCSQIDRRGHEDECTLLNLCQGGTAGSSSSPEVPSEAIRALGRICLIRKRSREDEGKDPEWWASVQAMENHVQKLSETGDSNYLAGLARTVGHYLALSGPKDLPPEKLFASFGFGSPGEILQLCSAFQVNSFTLSLPDVSPIGVAISPTIALANHSCEPNAVVVFPEGGRGMTLVAIKYIKPGEEIVTSYIDVSLPLEQRQAELSSTYRFKCDCSLCERDTRIRSTGYQGKEADMRSALWHQGCTAKRKGKGSLPVGWQENAKCRVRCDRCAGDFEANTSSLKQLCDRATDILEADAKGKEDPNQDRLLFQLIPTLHSLMPPSSYPLLALLRLQLLRVRPSNPAELSHLDALCNIVSSASSLVYPAHHPVLAILQAEWGQILTQTFEYETQKAVAGRLVKSVEILRKALELCRKAFGPGGGVEGKKVAEVLRGIEGELHVARTLGRQ